jgi:hypothetical protein
VAGVKTKNRYFNYSDLDSANEHCKNALNIYFDGNRQMAKEQFAATLVQYQKILNGNKPGTDANVKDILHYNMSVCNTFLNDFAAAWDNYNQCTMQGIDVGDYYKRQLRERIEMYQFRNAVENAHSK